MKLTKLQQLAEGSNDATRAKIDKIITPLQDKVDAAYEAIAFIRNQLQSDVLNDLLKEAGFPATETKMAIADAQKAFEAVRGLEEEINDLHMALGTHFEADLNEAFSRPTRAMVWAVTLHCEEKGGNPATGPMDAATLKKMTSALKAMSSKAQSFAAVEVVKNTKGVTEIHLMPRSNQDEVSEDAIWDVIQNVGEAVDQVWGGRVAKKHVKLAND